MTGATGDLTPDDTDRPFIPAEQRKTSGPEAEDPENDPQDIAGGAPPGEADGDESATTTSGSEAR
jgi:hypothetical protein